MEPQASTLPELQCQFCLPFQEFVGISEGFRWESAHFPCLRRRRREGEGRRRKEKKKKRGEEGGEGEAAAAVVSDFLPLYYDC